MAEYFTHILVMISIYVILGTSFDLLIGYTGLISLCHAAFFAIGAYASALLTLKAGWNFFPAVLAGMVLSGLISLVIAVPSLRVKGDYLVISSFGFQLIVTSVLLNWDSLTNGPAGVPGIPRPSVFGFVITGNNFVALTVVIAVLCVFVAWRVTQSPFGRVLKGIREDEIATRSLGKNIVSFKIVVFAVACALAAVGGSLYASYSRWIGPESFNLVESIFIFSIVAVGGAGTIRGPIVGAVVLVTLPELLRLLNIPSAVAFQARQMLYATLLILFMRFRPQGLLGEYLGFR
ncbi:MAG: branched-chain amino acid ABC transporter permease [Chloroflexi bacterium]|nr:branched-chain amino acid ABC transporter permease [Chloroflexota bacterium]